MPVIIQKPKEIMFFKVTEYGFGTNFIEFFKSYFFAQWHHEILYINDTQSNLQSGYHLILDTFKDISGLEYTRRTYFSIPDIHLKESSALVDSHDIQSKKIAKQIFRFRHSIQERIDICKRYIPSIDYGVHIRTGDKISWGEMKAIPLQTYIDKIAFYHKECGKTTLVLYIMTDTQSVLTELHAQADPNWQIYNIPSPIQFQNGHNQYAFNAYPNDVKMDAFIHFLTELQILQESTGVLCTFTSNIGRFLRLTCTGKITSLD